MSDSIFTPGPWKVNNVFIENEENQYFVSQAKWGGANVAACGSSVGPTWDTNEANARLIAAAPDMYAILKAIEAYNRDGLNRWDWIQGEVAKTIAKTEGR